MLSFNVTYYDLVLNYKYQSTIQSDGSYSWGEIDYESYSSNRNWVLVYPSEDDGSRSDRDFFIEKINRSNLAGASTQIYDYETQYYYVHSTFQRIVKNPDGLFPVTECEESAEPVFVKPFSN